MAKEAYRKAKKVYHMAKGVKRGLLCTQKRPISMAKEAYRMAKEAY